MIVNAAISFLFAAAGAPATVAEPSAVNVFRDACMMGEVRLPANAARPTKRMKLPSGVLGQLSRFRRHLTPETQYYQLSLREGPAYLVIQPSTGRPGGGRYCSVASKYIRYWDARVATDQHPGALDSIGDSQRRKMERMGYSHTTSTLGFEIEVRRVDNFVDTYVVMTTFLPDRKTAQ